MRYGRVSNLVRLGCFAWFASVTSVLAVDADPITVTSGRIVVADEASDHPALFFDFVAGGAEYSGFSFDDTSGVGFTIAPFPTTFASGVQYEASISVDLVDVFASAFLPISKWDGEFHFDGGVGPLSCFQSIPFFGAICTLTAPASFSGTLIRLDAGNRELFRQQFVGAGTATIAIREGAGDASPAALHSFRFQFEPVEAPVPEPTTLLLLGSGIVGLGWRQRRHS